MPILKNHTTFEVARGIRLSLKVELGLAGLGVVFKQLKTRLGKKIAPVRPVDQSPAGRPQSTVASAQPKHRAPAQQKRAAEQRRRTNLRKNNLSKLPADEVQAAVDKVEFWYHRIEVAPGIVTPGVQNSDALLEALEVPDRLDGQRILDIGARDGYFSFAAEARGAEVLAIDNEAPHLTGFETVASLLNSSVEYKTINLYDLRPEEVGTFDGIFFLGLLYHLRDPMLGLDRLWALARPGATLWVESFVLDEWVVDPSTGKRRGALASLAPGLADTPIAQFYPGGGLRGDATNWWGPNLAALKAMVESAGFTVTRALPGPADNAPGRGVVVGRKKEDPTANFFRDHDRSVVQTAEARSRLHTELHRARETT